MRFRSSVFIAVVCFCSQFARCMDVNFIVATREAGARQTRFGLFPLEYNKIDIREVSLVFASLARSIGLHDNKKIRDKLVIIAGTSDPMGIIRSFDEANHFSNLPINLNKSIVVLFNEMFFGKESALEKNEVDEIIACYNNFLEFFSPDTYLYINFLYKDKVSSDSHINKQIETSKCRYKEIAEKEAPIFATSGAIASIFFEVPKQRTREFHYDQSNFNGKYLRLVNNHKVDSDVFRGELLINQTKILFQGKEIGFYNKSSFNEECLLYFKEGDTFKEMGIPFYLIGNFSTVWYEAHNPLLDTITSIVCYDVDVGAKELPPSKIFMFASNVHTDFAWSLGNRGIVDDCYVCADATGVISGINVDVMNTDYSGAVSGMFMPSKKLFPLKGISPSSFWRFNSSSGNFYKICVFGAK